MKNKHLIILFLIIFYQNISNAEIFTIESSEIKILDKEQYYQGSKWCKNNL